MTQEKYNFFQMGQTHYSNSREKKTTMIEPNESNFQIVINLEPRKKKIFCGCVDMGREPLPMPDHGDGNGADPVGEVGHTGPPPWGSVLMHRKADLGEYKTISRKTANVLQCPFAVSFFQRPFAMLFCSVFFTKSHGLSVGMGPNADPCFLLSVQLYSGETLSWVQTLTTDPHP